MKLQNALLTAILLGVTVPITSCSTEDTPQPILGEQGENGEVEVYFSCPACGMG